MNYDLLNRGFFQKGSPIMSKEKKVRRELVCEHCGEDYVYYSIKRIMRFCSRRCFNLAHADPKTGIARKAYFDHFRSAKSRGIPWHFTFEIWWKVWQESGRWAQRGNLKGHFVMARRGDVGPYSIENVRIITTEKNLAERKMPSGENASWSKLNTAQVIEIRKLDKIMPRRLIAKKFGIDRTSVSSICRGTSWRHVQ